MKQTFLSAFDIECHISEKFWYEVMEELWPKYMPVKMNQNDFRPCQFSSIFGENFGCNYYSVIWSNVSTKNKILIIKIIFFFIIFKIDVEYRLI